MNEAYGRARRWGDAVAGAGNTAAEVLSDLVETPGRALERLVSRVALGRSIASRIARRSAAVLAAALDLAAVALKAATETAASAPSALAYLIGAIIFGRAQAALVALAHVASSLAGGLLLVAGKLVTLLQVTLCIESPGRGATPDEIRILAAVFRGSLALSNVRLVQGRSGLFGANPRPFVLGNTIYLKRYRPEPGLLVHESTHVWQYQHSGARYASDAIASQLLLPDAYDWRGGLRRGTGRWVDLNPEAQAQLLEDACRPGAPPIPAAAEAVHEAQALFGRTPSPRPSARPRPHGQPGHRGSPLS